MGESAQRRVARGLAAAHRGINPTDYGSITAENRMTASTTDGSARGPGRSHDGASAASATAQTSAAPRDHVETTLADETVLWAAEESGRHATNLELFLDLVFVFAVTQVAAVLASNMTVAGFWHGLLLAWLVWWLWSQFTWLGTAIDLGGRSATQFLVLATVPLTLLMAVALPDAYASSGLEFAGAYLAVNLWALAIQGWGAWREPTTRAGWIRYAPLAALAPLVLVVGALLPDPARIVMWSAVALFNVVSAVAGGRGQEGKIVWAIDPGHFTERHALFVIISLGEILVAVGAAAAGVTLTPAIGAGLLAAVAVACVFWWTYFAFVPDAVERALRRASRHRRGVVARNRFTFGHFPIIFGLVLYAVVAKHVVAHPIDAAYDSDLVVLAGAITFFVGGLLGLQWQQTRRLAPERVAAIIAVAVVCFSVGPLVPGVVLLAVVAVVVAVMQTITLRRYDRMNAAQDQVAGPPRSPTRR
jgi:low temperature requirement protein LtrA